LIQVAWTQVRRRWARSVALLVGVVVATSGFTLLTGLSTSAQLETVGTVNQNYRAAYDILVRPKGTRSELETASGRVRPNFLSGVYGGITMNQLQTISGLDGVDVAAPVAMLGSVNVFGEDNVDVTSMVDRSAERQVLRLTPTWTADAGLTRATEPGSRFVYVTKRPLIFPVWINNGGAHYPAGTRPSTKSVKNCYDIGPPPLEVEADGTEVPLCAPNIAAETGWTGFSAAAREEIEFAQLLPDGTFAVYPGDGTTVKQLTMDVGYPELLQLAAIDPVQEAKLVGLSGAVVSGRYLTETDRANNQSGLPLIATSQPYLSGGVSVRVQQLSTSAADAVSTIGSATAMRRALDAAPGADVATVTMSTTDADKVAIAESDSVIDLTSPMQAAEPTYTQLSDGTLAVNPVTLPPTTWETENWTSYPPWLTQDTGFRDVSHINLLPMGIFAAFGTVVGTFDPTKLTDFSPLSTVPLETYQPPSATGADAASRAALEGGALLPSGAPNAYLSSPALLLTTIAALPKILRAATLPGYAPISSVRVRVAGVTGVDGVSRERVRLVASQIAKQTGLDVDITIGSSPAPQQVSLPAGRFGRPQLLLTEGWSKLGVATVIVSAANRKSELLSGLVLVVCVLFLGNAVAAAVRDRRTQLAVLACVGWSPGQLLRLVLAEIAIVGVTGGLFAIAVNAALAGPFHMHLPFTRQLIAFGVAVGITVIAGIIPAFRAGRTSPIGAVTDVANSAGSGRARRGVVGIAVVGLFRVPGRALLAIAALAVGVGGVTLVSAIMTAFRSSVVGSLLGDAVSLQVRPVDIAAVACTLILATVAVADVLFLNVREQAARYALLLATGWTRAQVAGLVMTQAVLLGLGGAIVGTGLAAYGLDRLTGSVPDAVWTVVAIVGSGGVAMACVAAIVPAAMLDRLPIAALLSRD
jgi:putative ABC transport system permease protein